MSDRIDNRTGLPLDPQNPMAIDFGEVRLIEPRKRKLIDPVEWSKSLIKGLIGSVIVSFVMFFVQVKAFVAFILAAILTFLGWTTKPPEAVQEAGKHMVAKFKDEIKGHAPPLPGMAPSIQLGAPKSPEQLKFEAEQREAERKRREESETKTLLARAAVIKLDCDKEWTLERLRIEVPAAEKRIKEEAEKKPYFARADKIGFQVEPSWDVKTLRQQVEAAEKKVADDAEYQASRRQYERDLSAWKERIERGPNGRCPRCQRELRFAKSRLGTQFVCPKCQGIYSVRQAMANFTPPSQPKEPPPPGVNRGLLGRFFR